MDKRVLVETIRELLRAELAVAERLAKDTAAAANHPEARPENDKDTRKVELSYLAAGQAARAQELEMAILLLASVPMHALESGEPLRIGALVELEVSGKAQRLLLCPSGGGLKVHDGRGDISVVTPQSPLGRGLVGKVVGDSFELVVGGRVRDVEIVGVE